MGRKRDIQLLVLAGGFAGRKIGQGRERVRLGAARPAEKETEKEVTVPSAIRFSDGLFVIIQMMAAEIAFSLFSGFVGGVVASGLRVSVYAGFFGFSAVTVAIFYLKKDLAKYFAAAFIAFVLGFAYFVFYGKMAGGKYPALGEKTLLEAVVLGEPRISGDVQRTKAELLPPHGGEIDIISDEGTLLEYGDRVKFRAALTADKYSIRPAARAYSAEIVSKNNGSGIKLALLGLKAKLIGALREHLSPPSAALMSGLLLGDRSGFSARFREAMKLSGTTHLVALSGFNIGILVYAIGLALGNAFTRKIKFAISLVAVLLFIVMVGAEASVVRAGIMGALLLLAGESGRIYSPRNAIALAGFAMILWDPNNIFDLGFILSFISLAGIVYILPAAKNIFMPGKKPEGIAEAALATVSAQAAVLPVVVKTFGGFSLTAIISNSLLTVLVPFAMLSGFLVAITDLFSGATAFFFAFFSEAIMKYFIAVIEVFSRLQLPFGGFLELPYAAAVYYILIIIFVYVGTAKSKK